MPGMGPPQKDASRRARRNATVAMAQLPVDGRKGAAPKWPLRADAVLIRVKATAELRAERLREQMNDTSDRRKLGRLERELDAALADVDGAEQELSARAERELGLWKQLWATPQAVMWERFRWFGPVAVFVRLQLAAEDGDLKAATEARQREDRLGLNPKGMLQNRWAIAADEVGEKREAKKSTSRAKPTGARARRGALRAVEAPKVAAGDA